MRETMHGIRFRVAMAEANGESTLRPHPPQPAGPKGPARSESPSSGEGPGPLLAENGANGPEELHGWKEIAAALGTNIRTAQKYERRHGLPIRRMPGKRGRVYALRNEILAWRDKRQPRESRNSAPAVVQLLRRRFPAGAGVVVTVIAAALLYVRGGSGPVVSLRWNGPVLEALDSRGETVWTSVFPSPPAVWGPRRTWIARELAGLGTVTLVFHRPSAAAEPGTLFCFDAGGKVQWTYPPERGESVSPGIQAFALVPWHSSEALVALAEVDGAARATRIRFLDSGGRPLAAVSRPGVFDRLVVVGLGADESPALIAGGYDANREQAALLWIDPGRVASPHGGGATAVGSSGSPANAIRALILFPRTRLNQRLDVFNRVVGVWEHGSSWIVRVEEDAASGGWVEYRLGPDLRPWSVTVSDVLRRTFRAESARGVLDGDWSPEDRAALLEGVEVVRWL